MIYFDNAATTREKPKCVYEAFEYYVREVGTSPGRGGYPLAVKASRMLYQSRKTVAQFFGIDDPADVIFTKNSTEAINLYLKGQLCKGDHVLISPFEHNAVFRPVNYLQQADVIEYDILSEDVFYSNPSRLIDYIKPNTKMVIITLASNLTGQIVFSKEVAAVAKEAGLTVFVDASQGGGKQLIKLKDDNIDVLAFTGHKDLLGLPGIGGLVSKESLLLNPLIQGGTGISGDSYVNPKIYPEAYEAGTMNMPSIWALKVALDYIAENSSMISQTESTLLDYLIERLKTISDITLYNIDMKRVPTLCFNVNGKLSSEVVEILGRNDICVRGGIHCAIKAHETLGTVKTGAVRVSLNFNNTKEEIDSFVNVLKEIVA